MNTTLLCTCSPLNIRLAASSPANFHCCSKRFMRTGLKGLQVQRKEREMNKLGIHKPVLSQFISESFSNYKNGIVVDATLGAGGHAGGILEKNSAIKLYGIDRDESAIKTAKENLKNFSERFKAFNLRFSQIDEINYEESVIGFLFDLGASLDQLKNPERGFSFALDAGLDMRMGRNVLSAYDVVNTWSKAELIEIFRENGEQSSRQIAETIVKNRPINSTAELSRLIADLKPKRSKIHPATKVFQAIRIAVNDELNELKIALDKAENIIASNGLIVTIAYHSGEDKIVKSKFDELVREQKTFKFLAHRKAIRPDRSEILENPAARSGRLRAVVKV
jgi:16S rRNA (cytosine1402-N4)-methyltransferase